MKNIYFTPGPSHLYPTVKQHIRQALDEDIPSLSHRSEKFHTIVKSVYDRLRDLLHIPADYQIFFVASGTEAMERILQNCVNESSFHFVNGSFSKRFYQTALELKKQAVAHTVAVGEAFDFAKVTIPNTELIAFTHNETSAGTAIPLDDIYRIAKSHPDSLTVVDIVSSVPYVNLDYSKLDCVFFSVQKGFGLPAGLGVLIISPRALQKGMQRAKNGGDVGSYHRFETMYVQAQKYQTIETPNVLDIYLLSNVISDMLQKGITVIRKETDKKAALLYTFFDSHNSLRPLVKEKAFRSNTVIVVETPKGSKPILDTLKQQGFIVGAGYRELKEKQIRIANFPATSQSEVQKLITAIKEL